MEDEGIIKRTKMLVNEIRELTNVALESFKEHPNEIYTDFTAWKNVVRVIEGRALLGENYSYTYLTDSQINRLVVEGFDVEIRGKHSPTDTQSMCLIRW